MIVYTYYGDPWKLKSGDVIRIYTICKTLRTLTDRIIVYNLNHLINKPSITRYENILYYSVPRKFYNIMAKLTNWRNMEELNPLMKLTHYIDEFIATIKSFNILKQYRIAYIFGSMTLFSFFSRVLGVRCKFIYDPLSNYAQTLYIRSRKSLKEFLRYGLYLALYKLQLKVSDLIIYPSRIDLENAKRMFDVKKALVVENPLPIHYHSEEYIMLRAERNDFSRPYFILLAGGKGPANEEAIKLTISVFNNLPQHRFKLFITGPWTDMSRYVKNSSIKLLGVVPNSELKKLLAISDYGLSPVFSHAAGTFLKVLAYIAAGLDIIVSTPSLLGIDLFMIRKRKVFLVRNINEYAETIQKIINNWPDEKTPERLRLHNVYTSDPSIIIREQLRNVLQSIVK